MASNFQIFPENIFDTGKAFLIFQRYILDKKFKIDNSPSLGYLTKIFLDLEIDKSYQTADWRVRPLTESKYSN